MTNESIKQTLEILKPILEKTPKLIKSEQSIYHVINVEHDELINSKLLAYYFNKNENHGFKRLFFDTLLTCLGLDVSDYQGDYMVKLEKAKIDILICKQAENSNEYEWAFIIENKVHHILNNPLEKYWKKVIVQDNDKKHGVVLSLKRQSDDNLTFPLNEKGEKSKFRNVLHCELVEEFKNKAKHENILESQGFVVFNEYDKSISSLYANQENIGIMEDRLETYINNSKEILEVVKLYEEMNLYIQNQVLNAMEKFGYGSKSVQKGADAMRLNPVSNFETTKYFRFWVSLKHLLKWNLLYMHFELKDGYLEHGKLLDDVVKSDNKTFLEIEAQRHDDSKSDFHVIAKLSIENFWKRDSNRTLEQQVYDTIQKNFFDEEAGVLCKCVKVIKEIT